MHTSSVETPTASLHYSQVDLSAKGEVVLRDKGYLGAKAKGIDLTMKRRTTDQPIGELDEEGSVLILL